MVPTSSLEETRSTLERVVGDTGVKITLTQKDAPPRFPASVPAIDPSLLGAVTELTHKMWGDIPVVPTMSTGATDSHWLREAGIPSYGVSGLFSVPGETNAHGRDEKLRVKSYYEGLEFLDQLVRRLGGSVVP
jgi:acetylornithine deacetylase/succinyl-diaminopimelate desuccinylase-like protein